MDGLEKRFNGEMELLYTIPKEKYGRRFPRYWQMLKRHGGLETAKRLLRPGKPHDGFATLIKMAGMDGIDLSVEALVVREPWRRMFSEDELRIAQRRLDDAGYKPKRRTS